MKYRSASGCLIIFILAPLVFLFFSCASVKVTTAEEYFSLGMAYFDLGQAASDSSVRTKYFLEAEKWLSRARSVDKTKSASEYNMGRIAFETGRYQDALKYFEGILKKDSNNILALKASAYTRIKTGDIDAAETHYKKLLALIPESADDGYNYALVLYYMEKYENAEEVLARFRYALFDNSNSLLLYARTQKALNKIEAADTYERWLVNNKDAKVRCEYAAVLETQEFYARALEEYRLALDELAETSIDPKKSDIRFYIARLLMIADRENEEGIKELQEASGGGYANLGEFEKLAEDSRISDAARNALLAIIEGIKQKPEPLQKTETESGEENSGDTMPENESKET